jgi:hypothetical protein
MTSPGQARGGASLPGIGREVAFEVHGGVEDADDFELSGAGAEEDDVFALGGDPASGEEVGAEAVAVGVEAEVLEACPATIRNSLNDN